MASIETIQLIDYEQTDSTEHTQRKDGGPCHDSGKSATQQNLQCLLSVALVVDGEGLFAKMIAPEATRFQQKEAG